MKHNLAGRAKVAKSLRGRICSDEHKNKVALANIGKILVNNGNTAKRIELKELDQHLLNGWKKGAKPKNNNSQV